MTFTRSNSRSGIALVIVMICITVLSILAAGFAYSMRVEMKLARNSDSETELNWMGRSGVELARYVLAMQRTVAAEPWDSLNQKWAGGPGSMFTSNSPLAEIPMSNYELGNGRFTIKITDLERKMNLNTVALKADRDQAYHNVLEKAFSLIGVDAGESSSVIAAIFDWIDDNKLTRIGGTESDYYQGMDPPYFAKNGPIDDMHELLLVNGVTPDIFWGGVATNHTPAAFQKNMQRIFGNNFGNAMVFPVGLVDLFTPMGARLNINTASATALQMLRDVDEAIAAEIIRLRSGPDGADGTEDDTPFRNVGELINVPGINQQNIPLYQRLCDVRSSTFEVTVDAEIGTYKRQFHSVVARIGPRDTQVLSFSWK